MPIFILRLQATYHQKGFFNVTVDFDRYVRIQEGPVRLRLGRNGEEIEGRIDRHANLNGTARIFGGFKLRDWFQSNFTPMDSVTVFLDSDDFIILEKPKDKLIIPEKSDMDNRKEGPLGRESRVNDYSKGYEFRIFNPARGIHYYAISPIDEGGFGKVWNGLSAAGYPVAIKIIKQSSNLLADWNTWVTERNIYLACLNHPNIVATYDQFCSSNAELVIVMEKASGSLNTLVRPEKEIEPNYLFVIGTQICSALIHIHSIGVVHRDVTLKNILWFFPHTFKLADFGISKQGVSPEILARTFIGHKSFIRQSSYRVAIQHNNRISINLALSYSHCYPARLPYLLTPLWGKLAS
jgi:hypothetical protein